MITIDARRRRADLGRLFFLSEFATAVAGWVLEINPFDQPNVQEAKDNTKRVLEEGPPELEPGDLDALLDGLAPPRYLAIMGYLPYSDDDRGRASPRLRERADRASTASRPRSATARASCTRPASSTRAARRPARSSRSSTSRRADLEIPGEPYTLRAR